MKDKIDGAKLELLLMDLLLNWRKVLTSHPPLCQSAACQVPSSQQRAAGPTLINF